jgi:hypothetical protein
VPSIKGHETFLWWMDNNKDWVVVTFVPLHKLIKIVENYAV